jgi:CRISPR-associated endonuclease/helicase Cas3
MSLQLDSSDFPGFFRALWGCAPFPWQQRLVAHAWREGRFPELLDLPTGAGKTAVLDAAVFLMALGSARPEAGRRFPRRVLIVVDRRVVVDQAAERARRIAQRLATPDGPVLRTVARALRALAGREPGEDDGEPPLAWVQLRGGMARDEAWASDPAQPLIGAATVDQVGSRLLFRGYGISDGARPIHAGLLGEDTALFLDEVHLSEPFRATLEQVAELRGRAEHPPTTGWQVVEMSATPGRAVARAFRLAEEDRVHPLLRQRLEARKPARTVIVPVKGSEPRRREVLAREAVAQVRRLLSEQPHLRTVAVVVNRVDTARHAARLLERARLETLLLTGRSRPLDRDALLSRHAHRIRAGRKRNPEDPVLVVVATQCIEAGADFDFDGLVTECASLDALRQRFGRVDRLGELAAQGLEAAGIILAREDQLAEDASDPIYGRALAATFHRLSELAEKGGLDMGIAGFAAAVTPESMVELLAPRPRAPVLLGGHLDLWAQTRPRPHADPEVALWLHGIRPGSPDVLVVWRGDLAAAGESAEAWCAAVAACPPSPLEAVSLPIWAVRRWLQGADVPGVADVEGGEEDSGRAVDVPAGRVRFVLWRGDDSVAADDPALIRPGDALVVPTAAGGLDAQGNWDPEARAPVSDLGDLAQLIHRGRPVIRLLPELWPELPAPPRPGIVHEDEERSPREIVADYIRELRAWREAAPSLAGALGGDERRALVLEVFLDRAGLFPQRIEVAADGEGWWVLRGARLGHRRLRGILRRHRGEAPFDEFSSAEDSSSFPAREVALVEHQQGVARLARRFAEACGLPQHMCEALGLAAELHDLGKIDPRFQALLCGGDRALAAALLADGEPLAKGSAPAECGVRGVRLAPWRPPRTAQRGPGPGSPAGADRRAFPRGP